METIARMYNLCAFKGCPNGYGYGRPLFPFPQSTNPRFEVWLENCGNKAILGSSESTIKKFGLCSDHFTPDSFCDEERQKLRRDAVPEPYSPTFKRLYPLTKANTRIYDHNYALVSNETDKAFTSFKSKLLSLTTYNSLSRVASSSDTSKHNQGNNGPKTSLGSPRLKREKPFPRTYVKKNLIFGKDSDVTAKSLSSADSALAESSTELGSASRLAVGSETSTLSAENLAPSSTENVSTNRRGRSGGIEGRTQEVNPQVGGAGLVDKEVGILRETNNELRTQNKLLRKLNGQLKLKMKRSEDRNAMLKMMLEKACSVDGFLDLHRCTNLTVRNLIKEQIHKSKIPSTSRSK